MFDNNKRRHSEFKSNASRKFVAIGFGHDERIRSKKKSGVDGINGNDETGPEKLDSDIKPIRIDCPRIIAEFAREFGWSLDKILEVPAPTFFAMLKSVRQIKKEEMAVQLRELCDIQAISWGGTKYLTSLKSSYSEMTMTPDQLKARLNPRVFDCNVEERADAAAEMFKSFLGQAKKMDVKNVK